MTWLNRPLPSRQGGGRWFEPSIAHFGKPDACRLSAQPGANEGTSFSLQCRANADSDARLVSIGIAGLEPVAEIAFGKCDRGAGGRLGGATLLSFGERVSLAQRSMVVAVVRRLRGAAFAGGV
jgi:hypothetical protein